MPDPRPEDQRETAARRNRVHDLICKDAGKDSRYAKPISNREKVAYICGVLSHPAEGFDLELPLPVDDWIASDDNSLICAGLYLNDLRLQFYRRLHSQTEPQADFLRIGEAEFWHHAFHSMINRRMNGLYMADERVLN